MQAHSRLGRPILLSLALWLLLAMPGLALAQTVLATTTTSPSGSFDVEVTIPESIAPGIYDLTATGEAPAAASYPPSSSPNVTLSKTTVVVGETLRVSGGGWSASTQITLRLQLVRLTEASFTLAQATETRTARARLQVVAQGAGTGTGDAAAAPSSGLGKILSRTGVTSLPLLAAGLGTILLGTVLVSAGRRRLRGKASSL